MSLKTEPHNLVGLADPFGKAIGFLIPVFACGGSNALRVERVGTAGHVEAFVDLQPQETMVLPAPRRESKVGGLPHWAFGFGAGDIVLGWGNEGRDALQARLRDPFLVERPLLALEVVEFLHLRAERVRIANLALQRLREIAPGTADRWRDLAVLTPDIRDLLRRLIATEMQEEPAPNLQRVTVRVQAGVVQIRGFEQDRYPNLIEQITKNIESTLDDLQAVYGKPTAGWKLQFIKPKAPPTERIIGGNDLASLSALVYVADEDADLLQRVFSRPVADTIGLYPPRQFREFVYQTSEFQGPAFVLFRMDEQLGPVWPEDSRPPERAPIGLAMRTSAAPSLSPSERAGLGRYTHPTIVVSRRSLGAWAANAGLAGETRDAVRILSAAWDHRLTRRLPGNTSFFVSARGVGPERTDDAWAQIYGRCSRLGLTRIEGERFEISRTHPGIPRRPLVDILFHRLQPVNVRPDRDPSGRPTVHAAVLVTVDEAPPGHDSRLYSRAVEAVLKNQGWSISGKSGSDKLNSVVTIHGKRGRFDLSTSRETRRKRVRYPFQALLDRDLADVKHIAATEDAGVSTVLSALFERQELLATVRDLSMFPAEGGTIWTLLGSQMRRFSSSLPARPRSHYFGMLSQAAVQRDRLELENADQLVKALRHQSFGEEVHLLCIRIRYEPERAVAILRLTPPLGPRKFRRGFSMGEDALRFELIVTQDGPRIVSAG